MRKKFAILSVIMLAALILAACGPAATQAPAEEAPPVEEEAEAPAQQAEEPMPAEEEAAPAEEEAPVEEEAPAESDGSQVGGHFVIASTTAVDTLNPIQSVGGLWALQFMNGSLIAKDPDTMEIVPYLAESWEISEDGTVYTFKLREDVKFHNGDPLTAEDFVYTIQQMTNPEAPSYCGNISYAGVVGVEATGPYTLQITIAAPNYYFLSNLDVTSCGPVSKAYAESAGDDLASNPVGVGPFRFVEWEPGVKVVMERNPDFDWGPPFTHGGPAYIETVEFRTVADIVTILAAVEADEVDWSYIDNLEADRILSNGTHDVQRLVLGGTINTLLMNTNNPALADIKVRTAINHAIDRDVLIQVITAGAGQPFWGALTPNTQGYCVDVGKEFAYDLDAAKTMLEEAGYTYSADGMLQKDEEPVVLKMGVFNWREKLSTLIQEQLRELGIEVELVTGDTGQLVGQLFAGEFDLFCGGFEIYNASALNMMYNSVMIGTWNTTQFTDPDLDAALATMMTATDPQVNADAACSVQQFVVDNVLSAPLYTEMMSAAVTKDVAGVGWPSASVVQLYDAYFVNP